MHVDVMGSRTGRGAGIRFPLVCLSGWVPRMPSDAALAASALATPAWGLLRVSVEHRSAVAAEFWHIPVVWPHDPYWSQSSFVCWPPVGSGRGWQGRQGTSLAFVWALGSNLSVVHVLHSLLQSH